MKSMKKRKSAKIMTVQLITPMKRIKFPTDNVRSLMMESRLKSSVR